MAESLSLQKDRQTLIEIYVKRSVASKEVMVAPLVDLWGESPPLFVSPVTAPLDVCPLVDLYDPPPTQLTSSDKESVDLGPLSAELLTAFSSCSSDLFQVERYVMEDHQPINLPTLPTSDALDFEEVVAESTGIAGASSNFPQSQLVFLCGTHRCSDSDPESSVDEVDTSDDDTDTDTVIYITDGSDSE